MIQVQYLTTHEVQGLLEQGSDALILDVRTEPEWEAHHIPGATLIPMHTILERLSELDLQRTTIVVCEHGVRSENVATYLAAREGFTDIGTMMGGMAEWTGPKAYGP